MAETSRESKDISKVLISQNEPKDKNSAFYKLRDEYGLEMDFKSFIKIEYKDFKDFRKQKIDILAHSAIILTSRNAVDRLFKLCEEAKIEMPADMKYFCVSEQTANYLQKYIVIRKRKIFTGERRASDLFSSILKHKNEKFLFPCSNIRSNDLPNFLNENEIQFSEAIIYETKSADLSKFKLEHDLIAFFSPSGVKSLLENYPEFKQGDIRIAAFGPTTAKAVLEAGFILDIEAPKPNAPSMTGAIDNYIKSVRELISG